jgi:hypothetical protein
MTVGSAARGRIAALVLGFALLGVMPGRACAQRVVPSRPWSPTAADGNVDIYLRAGARLSPRVAILASSNARLYQRVDGFRADSLVLALGTQDSAGVFRLREHVTLAASEVDSVNVWRRSRTQARLSTGGETALYTGLLGTIVGALAGGHGDRWQGAGIGLGAAALAGFVWGVARPYDGYETYRQIITLRVQP